MIFKKSTFIKYQKHIQSSFLIFEKHSSVIITTLLVNINPLFILHTHFTYILFTLQWLLQATKWQKILCPQTVNCLTDSFRTSNPTPLNISLKISSTLLFKISIWHEMIVVIRIVNSCLNWEKLLEFIIFRGFVLATSGLWESSVCSHSNPLWWYLYLCLVLTQQYYHTVADISMVTNFTSSKSSNVGT